MPEQTTAMTTTDTATDQDWDSTPALTLLAVILLWYAGTIGIVLTQVI